MFNINLSNEWDELIETIEKSAAASAGYRLIDPVLAAWERSVGLGEDTRRVLFGKKQLPFDSSILNYVDFLKGKAREEKEIEVGTDESTRRTKLKKCPDGRKKTDSLFDRINTAVSEVAEDTPKILPGDAMTPRERIDRHVRFEPADRVAFAPLLGFHTPRAGGVSVREYMTDGKLAALAARRAWDLYGGFDMLPVNFPMGYVFPLVPESHSRFCAKWFLPADDDLPKMDEQPRPVDYDVIREEGLSPFIRTERGALPGEFLRMAGQGAVFAAETALNFPRADLFQPYALGVINHPADLLSMWLGFEKFMTDCALDPVKLREACERLAPGLVELGLLTGRLSGGKQILYGVSRISGSWISRKMFDDLFAGVFKSQVEQAVDSGFSLTYHLDNDYTPLLDFFLELPKQSGYMHLDQTDLFKAKEVLHGHLCLMGNLHPGLLAAGSEADVTAQCERLIKEVGAGGGFILASACEVPINTPVENLKAAKSAVDRWGWY